MNSASYRNATWRATTAQAAPLVNPSAPYKIASYPADKVASHREEMCVSSQRLPGKWDYGESDCEHGKHRNGRSHHSNRRCLTLSRERTLGTLAYSPV